MLRYAWAYQGRSSAEHATYPVQTISARFERISPSARITSPKIRARIKRQTPLTRTASRQLFIFNLI